MRLHEILFPSNDEYDERILDPLTVNGSPYGGFARASRSRLASLPLILPSSSVRDRSSSTATSTTTGTTKDDNSESENSATTTTYISMTDAMGRDYICRTYSEDEIVKEHRQDSVFDPVVLLASNKDVDETMVDSTVTSTATTLQDDDDINIRRLREADALTARTRRKHQIHADMLQATNLLIGVCTQIHKGWWSYEWCFGKDVRQFHIEQTPTGIQMESVTLLGSFSKRTLVTKDQMDELRSRDEKEQQEKQKQLLEAKQQQQQKQSLSSSHSEETIAAAAARDKAATPNPQLTTDQLILPLQGDEVELGKIVDIHEGGTTCDAAATSVGEEGQEQGIKHQQPRTTQVEYRCCAPEELHNYRPLILYQGKRVSSDIVAIIDIQEPTMCHYHLLICTPILCEGMIEYYDKGPLVTSVSSSFMANTKKRKSQMQSNGQKTKTIPPANRIPQKENESIRETIHRTLEGVCLLSHNNNNHWWSYELCHGKHVRQFHESNVFDPISGLTTREVDSEYQLGFYDAERLDAYDRVDEIKHVVNVTKENSEFMDDFILKTTTKSPMASQHQKQHGNGAYFVQEYTNGQECTGDANVKGIQVGISRATTVRFFCGLKYQLSNVHEDATCHYVMDVTIPDLCQNPLFQKPKDPKQIIKCLPAA